VLIAHILTPLQVQASDEAVEPKEEDVILNTAPNPSSHPQLSLPHPHTPSCLHRSSRLRRLSSQRRRTSSPTHPHPHTLPLTPLFTSLSSHPCRSSPQKMLLNPRKKTSYPTHPAWSHSAAGATSNACRSAPGTCRSAAAKVSAVLAAHDSSTPPVRHAAASSCAFLAQTAQHRAVKLQQSHKTTQHNTAQHRAN
jgi:hypothetical protein